VISFIMAFPPISYIPLLPIRATCTTHLILFYFNILIILGEEYSYEDPRYAIFSNLLSLHPSSVQIFSSASCSQTFSVYVPTLSTQTKLRTDTESQIELVMHILISTFLDSRCEDKVLDWKLAKVTRIQFPFNFLISQTLICYCRSQIFQVCHLFKRSVFCLYAMILLSITSFVLLFVV
jgi:hypothetical protein